MNTPTRLLLKGAMTMAAFIHALGMRVLPLPGYMNDNGKLIAFVTPFPLVDSPYTYFYVAITATVIVAATYHYHHPISIGTTRTAF